MKIVDIKPIVFESESGEVLFQEEPHVMSELVRHSQAGLDVRDPLQTEVWTSRFATALNERYGTSFSSAQAYQIASHVVAVWKDLRKVFYVRASVVEFYGWPPFEFPQEYALYDAIRPAMEARRELRARRITSELTEDRLKNLLIADGIDPKDAAKIASKYQAHRELSNGDRKR